MNVLELSFTNHGLHRTRGGYLLPVNTADGGVAVTVTTRYEAIGANNIVSLGHYPMTVVLQEYVL